MCHFLVHDVFNKCCRLQEGLSTVTKAIPENQQKKKQAVKKIVVIFCNWTDLYKNTYLHTVGDISILNMAEF